MAHPHAANTPHFHTEIPSDSGHHGHSNHGPHGHVNPISHVPEHLKKFVVDQATPFYTPMSARWKHSYAYATVVLRSGIILDLTLDQFRVDMENLLEEEARAEEEALRMCEEICCEDDSTCCDEYDEYINDGNYMTLKLKGLPAMNVAGIGPDGLHFSSVDSRKPLRWICTPPPLDYSFLESEKSDLALGIKLWTYKAAGLKLDRKIPPKVKSDRNLCAKRRIQPANGPCSTDVGNDHHQKKVNEKKPEKSTHVEEIPPCDPKYKKKKEEAIQKAEKEKEVDDGSLYDDPRFEEWNNVERALMELKEEVSKNIWFKYLHSQAPDASVWNQFLKERPVQERTPKLRWMCTVWMYTECYLFRRIYEIFETTESLRSYDPFRTMKEKCFHKSIGGMDKVAIDFLKMASMCPIPLPESSLTKQYLHMLLTLSMWGNRPDLTEGGPTCVMSDFTGGNPLLRALTFGPSILIDEMDCVWNTLLDKKLNFNRRVDIITDNAGFELFADMILADFILTFRLADRIHFHVKAIPWFISDVTKFDLYRIIELMAENRKKSVPLAKIAERWVDYIACGQWIVEDEYFWTLPFSYDEMRCMDGPLYDKLSRSSLLIFKGDLNYRKLMGDINWEPSVSFKTALRHFRPTSLIALRAFKSDLICGVPISTSMHMHVPRAWMLTGKFAVAQYARRKKCVPGLPGPP